MKECYDAVVVGGGPAGLTAAIYLARARYRVLVVEKEKFGGQITITAEIVNYPGVKYASGTELTETMRAQAEEFGAEFLEDTVVRTALAGEDKTLYTESGRELHAIGVVLAVGASPKQVGFAGEREYRGRGVAYCATCDGEFFAGREVIVVGGGFAAVEEAIFLTRYASKVTILVRGASFSCAAGTVEKLSAYPEIEVKFHTEVVEVGGEAVVTYVRSRDNRSGKEETTRAADGGPIGVFVFVGYAPSTKWLEKTVQLDENGYIVTDSNRQTSVRGVYAAGDVCIKNLRQVVTAVSDGAVAATSLERYVSEIRDKKGLPKAAAGRDSRHTRPEPKQPVPKASGRDGGADVREKLTELVRRFARPVTLVTVGRGETFAALKNFTEEYFGDLGARVRLAQEEGPEPAYIDLRTEEGPAGIRYYSVPGGHEFQSFATALYNCAGPGQPVEESLLARIRALRTPRLLQVVTTLTCTNCPDVVVGTQRLASLLENVQAEMYDAAKCPEIRERYHIMAVPCLIVDEERTFFGRRSLAEIVGILEEIEETEEKR